VCEEGGRAFPIELDIDIALVELSSTLVAKSTVWSCEELAYIGEPGGRAARLVRGSAPPANDIRSAERSASGSKENSYKVRGRQWSKIIYFLRRYSSL
jgi:hypothetical protein